MGGRRSGQRIIIEEPAQALARSEASEERVAARGEQLAKELESSRKEALRADEENRAAQTRLAQERVALLARASESDQAMNMAKDVAGYAAEATQKIQ